MLIIVYLNGARNSPHAYAQIHENQAGRHSPGRAAGLAGRPALGPAQPTPRQHLQLRREYAHSPPAVHGPGQAGLQPRRGENPLRAGRRHLPPVHFRGLAQGSFCGRPAHPHPGQGLLLRQPRRMGQVLPGRPCLVRPVRRPRRRGALPARNRHVRPRCRLSGRAVPGAGPGAFHLFPLPGNERAGPFLDSPHPAAAQAAHGFRRDQVLPVRRRHHGAGRLHTLFRGPAAAAFPRRPPAGPPPPRNEAAAARRSGRRRRVFHRHPLRPAGLSRFYKGHRGAGEYSFQRFLGGNIQRPAKGLGFAARRSGRGRGGRLAGRPGPGRLPAHQERPAAGRLDAAAAGHLRKSRAGRLFGPHAAGTAVPGPAGRAPSRRSRGKIQGG